MGLKTSLVGAITNTKEYNAIVNSARNLADESMSRVIKTEASAIPEPPGFFKELADACSSAAKSGAKSGVVAGILDAQRELNNKSSNTAGKRMDDLYDFSENVFRPENSGFKLSSSVVSTKVYGSSPYLINKDPMSSVREELNSTTGKSNIVTGINSDVLKFSFPNWNYGDWINERLIWQRGLSSIGGEPGWFYFKVFFKFDSQHGLLGGVLNNNDIIETTNTAAKFLHISKNLYKHEKLDHRLTALYKFVSLLSYIETNSPWVFKTIKGLDKAVTDYTNEFSKEQSIEIGCNFESVDFRLSTLMELYKYVCYDDINCKEILPENLRKFDMSVLVFNTPIKKFHTAMKTKESGNFNYKGAMSQSAIYDEVMSYKLFTFKNCEISKESLGMAISSDMNNEAPFQMGNNSIKINYDRVYIHSSNEFMEFMFGSDGFYYNRHVNRNAVKYNVITNNITKTQQDLRYKALRRALTDFSFSPENKFLYKSVVDASEELSRHIIYHRAALGTELGNNLLLKLLKTSYSSSSILGSLYGDVGVGSQYYMDKMNYYSSHTPNEYGPNFKGVNSETHDSKVDKLSSHTPNKYGPNFKGVNSETHDLKVDKLSSHYHNYDSDYKGPGSDYFHKKIMKLKYGGNPKIERPRPDLPVLDITSNFSKIPIPNFKDNLLNLIPLKK